MPTPNFLAPRAKEFVKGLDNRALVDHKQYTRFSSDLQYLLVSTVLVPKFNHIFSYIMVCIHLVEEH